MSKNMMSRSSKWQVSGLLLAVLPATIGMGMSFPLVAAAAGRDGARVGGEAALVGATVDHAAAHAGAGDHAGYERRDHDHAGQAEARQRDVDHADLLARLFRDDLDDRRRDRLLLLNHDLILPACQPAKPPRATSISVRIMAPVAPFC